MNNKKREKRRNERLSWFAPDPVNQVLRKDGFVYFKHWDGNYKRWTVDRFTEESWTKMKNAGKPEHTMEEASKELENKLFYD